MKLKEIIKRESKRVDEKYASLSKRKLNKQTIEFPVPKTHPRYENIESYSLVQKKIDDLRNKKGFIITSNEIHSLDFTRKGFQNHSAVVLSSNEAHTKNKAFGDALVKIIPPQTIIGIGGGLICNVASYVAEQFQSDLILVPTTILSMADSNGGKVRLNHIIDGRFHKHQVKSFYEPNQMILDERFISTLPKSQISMGLVEIIKHGLFQSEELLNYLIRHSEEIMNKNVFYTKKGILWAADLKRICLEVDHEEQAYGSKGILRAGHEISDRLEEESEFKIPHGLAVSYGIIRSLKTERNSEKLELAKKAFELYKVSYKKDKLMKLFK